jgi:glycerol-3-phosphate acyltransferase PlsX
MPVTIRVALDVMGADRGPAEIIDGGLDAALELLPPAHRGEHSHRAEDQEFQLELLLIGDAEVVSRVLATKSVRKLPPRVRVIHAADVVDMGAKFSDAIKMKESSIAVGLRMLQQKEADAFVSPGNTAAIVGFSLTTLGRMEHVIRPAIASIFPTTSSRPTILLDCGANAETKTMHLVQYALMGSVYASVLFNYPTPRVGLLSIGEEATKGNEETRDAGEFISGAGLNFVGNVEGRDILSGTVDVVVTDGFTGNIILKFAESIQPFLVKAVRRQLQTNLISRVGVWLLGPFLRRMRRTFDYSESGGAPLLGVNGTVVVCHGASTSKAIRNAVRLAYETAQKQIVPRLNAAMKEQFAGADPRRDSKAHEHTNTSTDRRDGEFRPTQTTHQR